MAFGIWLRHGACLPARHGEGMGTGRGREQGRLHPHPRSPVPGSEAAVGRCSWQDGCGDKPGVSPRGAQLVPTRAGERCRELGWPNSNGEGSWAPAAPSSCSPWSPRFGHMRGTGPCRSGSSGGRQLSLSSSTPRTGTPSHFPAPGWAEAVGTRAVPSSSSAPGQPLGTTSCCRAGDMVRPWGPQTPSASTPPTHTGVFRDCLFKPTEGDGHGLGEKEGK